MTFILPNFTKLIITQEKFVGIYCKELYPNRTKTVENRDQISFTSFGKECFSLHRLSLSHNYSLVLSRDLLHSLKDAADTHKISFMPFSEVYFSLLRKCTDKVVPIHAMKAYGWEGGRNSFVQSYSWH